MAIQPSRSSITVKLALQFPQPPALKSFSPSDVQEYARNMQAHLDTLNKVLARTFTQLALVVDSKVDKT